MAEQYKLEDVFKRSGVPTVTFVQPLEYEKLLVGLRTPGRGVVIEGPSGIGKTTAVVRALGELGLEGEALPLSARKAADRKTIAAIPEQRDTGVLIIDDFHRLDLDVKASIADFMKTLADEERADVKLVIIGINRAGDTLVSLAPDLNNRIDTLRFEANPDESVQRVIELGENALNISLAIKDDIVRASAGSFYIAQMLCHETCLTSKVLETQGDRPQVDASYEIVLDRVLTDLRRAFHGTALEFAAGTKLRREGRAPYLHLLKWLAESDEWSIVIERELTKHPELKGSVGQVVTKGYLHGLLESKPDVSAVIHYDEENGVLGIEDPQFVFYIRNLLWNRFAVEVGFFGVEFDSRYDLALSFAGANREDAAFLFDQFSEMELEVFYDHNEQSRILAENVEDYLGPIYKSEARYVIVLLGADYPKRIWTKFESDQFRDRFGDGAVIPVWYSDAPPGLFDETTKVGGFGLNVDGNREDQLREFADLVRAKIASVRIGDESDEDGLVATEGC